MKKSSFMFRLNSGTMQKLNLRAEMSGAMVACPIWVRAGKGNIRSGALLILCALSITLPYMALYQAPDSFRRLLSESSWSRPFHRIFGWGDTVLNLNHNYTRGELATLRKVLSDAAFGNKTLIMTTLNQAWAAEDTMIDLFLESFQIGNGTETLLKHLVIIALDQVAYNRCIKVHKYCFSLRTDGVNFSGEKFFMSSDYLKMMWRRIDFLRMVLEMGYSFVFSDADIMWLRNPFSHFLPDADFQIACDKYNGNSTDLNNEPNGGFVYVRSSNATIAFYKYWYDSRQLHPGMHDQDVLTAIQRTPEFAKIGIKMKFLSTETFGGFCQLKNNLRTVCTMHANCCKGLTKKLSDLRLVLNSWKNFQSMTEESDAQDGIPWPKGKCMRLKKNYT